MNNQSRILGWSALGTASLAVLAWAACCVLPLALSLLGLGVAGTTLIAGQRTWLTLGAAIILAAGWWSVLRQRRACAQSNCPPPSRLSLSLLAGATLLVGLAMVWQSLIEPWAMKLLIR